MITNKRPKHPTSDPFRDASLSPGASPPDPQQGSALHPPEGRWPSGLPKTFFSGVTALCVANQGGGVNGYLHELIYPPHPSMGTGDKIVFCVTSHGEPLRPPDHGNRFATSTIMTVCSPSIHRTTRGGVCYSRLALLNNHCFFLHLS
jgi:hypothetical protein